MYAKRAMTPLMALDLDDDHDENKELIEFYERNFPFLMRHPVSIVPYHVIRKIAVMLHGTALVSNYDWQIYAAEMGIADNFTITEIKVAAESQQVPALLIAMDSVLRRNGLFGQVIKALLTTQRFDILRAIESYVRELVESNSKTGIKRIVSVEEQTLGLLEARKSLAISSQEPRNSLSDYKSENHCTVKFNSTSLNEHKKCELNSFQQSCVNTYSTDALEIRNSSKSTELSSEENVEAKQSPSAPTELLTVLIQHTEFDSEVAEQLSVALRDEGMTVTTLSDMEQLIPMDAIGALNTMFQEVDFIVPIVSGSFLKQIYPQNYEKYLESTYAMNNRHLYQLIMNEYRNNRCVNFRVRPVIVPEMNRRLLVKDVILSFSLRLWNELPKLIRVLRKNKALEPQNLVK